MLLFSRVVTLTGSPRRALPWAMEITSYVNAHSTLPFTCWSGSFGYPLGTMAWSAMVESQAQLAEATGGLLADEGYLDLLDAAADLVTTPGQDLLRQVVYGTPGDPPPIGAVAAITTATAVVDRMADALGWAVQIAQYVEGVIGTPVGVLTDSFGTMGGIAWIGLQPDLPAAEAAGAKMRGDAGYLGQRGHEGPVHPRFRSRQPGHPRRLTAPRRRRPTGRRWRAPPLGSVLCRRETPTRSRPSRAHPAQSWRQAPSKGAGGQLCALWALRLAQGSPSRPWAQATDEMRLAQRDSCVSGRKRSTTRSWPHAPMVASR